MTPWLFIPQAKQGKLEEWDGNTQPDSHELVALLVCSSMDQPVRDTFLNSKLPITGSVGVLPCHGHICQSDAYDSHMIEY